MVRLFSLMFAIVCLINVNFTVLRSMRNALTVVDLGGSAALVPYFELFGTLPAAIVITAALAWLMNRMPLQRAFAVATGGFLLFYVLFVFVFYPFASLYQEIWWIPRLGAMLFYSMAELWKVALLSVLFWGLVNQYLSLSEAKRFYAPTILGGSIGAIFAGPLITFCTSETLLALTPWGATPWEKSIGLLTLLVIAVGLITVFLYLRLSSDLARRTPISTLEEEPKPSFSLRESFALCRKSPYLMLLIWIVCADYIAYGLGEVVFLDVLKQRFPDAKAYCQYMGMLGTWSGILTAFFALLVTPWLVQRYKWVVASLITPILIFAAAGAFFTLVWTRTYWVSTAAWLTLTVTMGSLQYCLCRAAKYTLFDTAKELAFIYLPDSQRMQGKLVVDGISARLGRGSASILSISLIATFGGVFASAVATGLIAGSIAFSSVIATWRLGTLVDRRATVIYRTRPVHPSSVGKPGP